MHHCSRCDDEVVGTYHFSPLGQIGPNLSVLARPVLPADIHLTFMF